MKSRTMLKVFATLIIALFMFSFLPVHMASANFNNGGFESGDFTSWVKSTYLNENDLTCLTGDSCITKTPGGTDLTNIVGGASVTPRSQSDANTGGVLTYPYNGHYSAVVNYQGADYNANEMTQQITTSSADVSPSDSKIHVYFVYAPVLQNPAHPPEEQPYMSIKLTDDTKTTTLFDSFVWAGDNNPNWQFVDKGSYSEVDFMDWQVENLAYDATAVTPGDQITMDIIASGCDQSGHWGYVYVDDFGTNAPDVNVHFDANGGTGSMSDETSPYGTAKALTSNSFTKASYAFSGWNTLANGTGTAYADGASYPFTAVATLYAQWTVNSSYTLTYIAGVHGSLTGTLQQTVNYGASGTAVTAVAVSGYHFVDWSDGSTANPRTDTNVTTNISVKASFLPEHVLNGGFNTYAGASKIPQNWTASNFQPTDGKDLTTHQEGTASVKIMGAPGVTKTLTQTIALSGLAGDTFYFSFQAKGKAIPVGGLCKAQVKLYNGATLVSTQTINCATGIYGFQLNTLNLTAAKAYNKVVVVFTYKEASGTVWFDAASAASPANH
jgi:hypothetical protein